MAWPSRRVSAASLFDRSVEISAARRADDLSVLVDERAAQEGALDPAGEFLALEGRVSLPGFRIGGAYGEGLVRVDKHDVGVEAQSDIAFAEQAEAPGGIPAQKLGHAIVREAALAPFAEHAGE